MEIGRSVLKKAEAEKRANEVSQVKYRLVFKLDEELDEFEGQVDISFHLENSNEFNILNIDFLNGVIDKLYINNIESVYKYDGIKILISCRDLIIDGENTVIILFKHNYSHTGDGLHRFKDPFDNKVYVYTNLEPFNANQVFPCFDQPDIKATYKLKVKSPLKWKIISNEKEGRVSEEDDIAVWEFPETQRFSTYLFALIGGPFSVWSSEWKDIELRLFARDSMAIYVRHEEWFDVTKAGFEFFEKKFNFPYPFGVNKRKYDQIIVPDFNAGAMENVAAVTYNESKISRALLITPLMRLSTAETILHELAHMWFGDLVTMKWWDDLWLNESFATFMAYWALDEYKDQLNLPNPWQEFYSGMESWAYHEDEITETTHPIITHADDTDVAQSNFDGITYGKGASVLKQLAYYIEEESFVNGLRRYFKKFQFGNATREEFLKELEDAAGTDLKEWENEWLRSSGTNSLKVELKCEEGRIANFALLQRPDESSKIFRSHRTQIALYKTKNGQLSLREKIPITYTSEVTYLRGALGLECPELVYPNHLDYDFVKVILDQQSLDTARKSISKIDDSMARLMIWDTLWKMVRDAELPAQRFVDIVISQGFGEKDESVLRKILGNLNYSLVYMADSIRNKYQIDTECFLEKGFINSEQGSITQLIYFQNLNTIVRSKYILNEYLSITEENKENYKGLKIDQVRRWEIISSISRNGDKYEIEKVKDMIRKEVERDNTDSGEKSAIRAEVSIPDEKNKEDWLNRIFNEKIGGDKLPVARSRVAMASFFRLGQEEITRFAIDQYFKKLPELFNNRSNEYLTNFARNLFPNHAEQKILIKTDDLFKRYSIPEHVSKQIKMQKFNLKKKIKARELSKKESESR